jgi:hypothetical protein
MAKNAFKIAALSLLAAVFVATPAWSRAEGTATNAPASSGRAPAKPKKHVSLPFHGDLTAVDAKAMTFTVDTLTLQITVDTLITRGGKSATLADGVVGERVSGIYKKASDGKLKATSLHFGTKTEEKKNEAPATGDNH